MKSFEPDRGDGGENIFAEGTIVETAGGDYTYVGVVVSCLRKKAGQIRYVVEDDRGMLFIFSAKNLQLHASTLDERVVTGAAHINHIAAPQVANPAPSTILSGGGKAEDAERIRSSRYQGPAECRGKSNGGTPLAWTRAFTESRSSRSSDRPAQDNLDKPGYTPENRSPDQSLRLEHSVHPSACTVDSANESLSSLYGKDKK